MSYKERYTYWIEKLPADDPMKKELLDIADDEAEIKERLLSASRGDEPSEEAPAAAGKAVSISADDFED